MRWLARIGRRGALVVLAGLVGVGIAVAASAGGNAAAGEPFARITSTNPPGLTAVTAPTSSSSSSTAGALCVSYTIMFTTSPVGGLAANSGTVTIVAPAGTVFPSDPSSYSFHDSATNTDFGASAVLSNGGATVTLTVLGTVNPNDPVTLTIMCVKNPAPAATGLTLTLSTSSDVVPTVTPTYATTTPQPVSGLTPVLLSSHVPGAACVTYALGFAASSTGGLVTNRGWVTLAGPPGLVFPSDPSLYAFHDSSTNTSYGAIPAVQNGGSTVAMTVGGPVNAGDLLSLTIKCVKNPNARAANDSFALSSSSDLEGISGPLFAIGQPSPPAPRNGHAVDVFVVSGNVMIKLPGQKTFTLLTAGEQIPLGTTVDATHGRVTLESARSGNGGLQTADFYDGEFVVGQHPGQSLTRLKLSGGNFASCRSSHASDLSGPVAQAAGRHPRRQLWGSGHGSYSTTGNSASATVRGTIWLTQDDCEGTLIRVARGIVTVQDFVRHKTILVHAGNSYFAAKKG